MRKLVALLVFSLTTTVGYTAPTTDQNVEYILNRVFNSSDNTLKATVSGTVQDPVFTDTTVVPEGLSGGPTVPPRQIGFTEFQRMNKGFGNELPLEEFKLKYVIETITGGVGVSGVKYIPEVGLLFLIDNNSVNVSIYRLQNGMSTEFGNITFSGFADPEDIDLIEIKRDSDGYPDTAMFIIAEEGITDYTIFEWDLQATSGTITKGTNTTTYTPTGMFSDSSTLGAEGVAWNPLKQVVLACNQGGTLECREFRIDQGTSPAATEPFDANTLWGSTLPGTINGYRWDPSTNSYIVIGDATTDTTANTDIIRAHTDTGAVLDAWDNFPADLSLVLADHSQWEGIDITDDGRYLIICGEATEILILERVVNHWVTTILPEDFVLDDNSFPDVAVVESTGTGTPRRNVASFDPTTDESVYLSFAVPDGYTGTQPTQMEIYWYANNTIATADAVWAAQVSATSEGDADSMVEDAAAAAAAAATVADNVNSTEANRLIRTTLKLSTLDSIDGGDYATIKFFRDADDSIGNTDNDSLTMDAVVTAVRVSVPTV